MLRQLWSFLIKTLFYATSNPNFFPLRGTGTIHFRNVQNHLGPSCYSRVNNIAVYRLRLLSGCFLVLPGYYNTTL